MKLSHPYYLDSLELTDEFPRTLVIERGDFFRQFVRDLINQINTEEGDFVLSENNAIISLKKFGIIVSDVISMGADSKQVKNFLAQEIVSECNEDKMNEIIKRLNDVGLEIISNSNYPLSFNMGLTIKDLVKLLDFQINVEQCSDAEAIAEYLKVYSDLLGKRLIVIIGMKDLISEEEYKEIMKMIQYRKHIVLMLEHRQHSFDSSEYTRIIDEDMCVI